MNRRAVAALAAKDARELLPLWTVTMAGLVMIGMTDFVTAAFLYAIPGAVLASLAPLALGAIIMGHEYRLNTMAGLLSLPVRRGTVLAVKAVVLGSLLALVALAAWWVGAPAGWLWLPLVCGFCLAPWFTLLMRSELAGLVFACGVPVGFLVAGEIAASLTVPADPDFLPVANLVRAWTVGAGTTIICVVALVDTTGRFLRLEAVDGGASRSGTARPVSGVARRRRQNLWVALIGKELRLQTLPLILGIGLTVANLVMVTSVEGNVSGLIDRTAAVMRPLLAMLLALLVGSIASSEERQLGVWSAQVLTPVSAWKQWTVKVAVVSGLALCFGVSLSDVEVVSWRFGYVGLISAFSIPFMAAPASLLALYVSSLSRRSVTALMASIGLVGLCFYAGVLFAGVAWRVSSQTRFVVRDILEPGDVSIGLAAAVDGGVSLFAWLVPLLAVAVFAMINHRRLDFSLRRVASQVVVLVAVVLLAVVVNAASEGATGAVIAEAARQGRTAR